MLKAHAMWACWGVSHTWILVTMEMTGYTIIYKWIIHWKWSSAVDHAATMHVVYATKTSRTPHAQDHANEPEMVDYLALAKLLILRLYVWHVSFKLIPIFLKPVTTIQGDMKH